MVLGLSSNIIGLILTIVACFAITSNNYDMLSSTAFSHGDINLVDRDDLDFQTINIRIGLTAVAIDNPNINLTEAVVSFDEFCDETADAFLQYFPPEGTYVLLLSKCFVASHRTCITNTIVDPLEHQPDCDKCNEISKSMVSTLIASVVSYFPSIFTNFTRMYHNYDVNCQKLFAIGVTTFSLILSLSTLMNYKNNCFDNFYDGEVPFDEERMPIDDDGVEAFAFIDFDWSGSTGLFCLLVATVIKIVDIVAHMALPSPSLTRNREEQANYERADTEAPDDPDHTSEEPESHRKTNERDDMETRIIPKEKKDDTETTIAPKEEKDDTNTPITPKEEEAVKIPNAIPEVK